MSKYSGARLAICPTGGSVTVAIAGNVGQGNDGVSLPCKGCLVIAREVNTGPVHMNIGAPASNVLGIQIPESVGSGSPFFVPISDVAQLYFYSGTDGDDVDITYFVG